MNKTYTVKKSQLSYDISKGDLVEILRQDINGYIEFKNRTSGS